MLPIRPLRWRAKPRLIFNPAVTTYTAYSKGQAWQH
jgi:hypothetical protein